MSGLPEPEQLAQEQPDLDIYDDTKVDAERQIELARRAESAAMATDERIANSEGADFDSSWGRVVLGNSHGFVRVSQFELFIGCLTGGSRSGVRHHAARRLVRRPAKVHQAGNAGSYWD